MKIKPLLSLVLVFAAFFIVSCSTNSAPGSNEKCIDGQDANGNPCEEPTPPGPNPPGPTPPSGDIGSHAALSSNQDAGAVQGMYNKWINTYYTTYEEDLASNIFDAQFTQEGATGTARIKAAFGGNTTGNKTCSEAIGYGMVLTALMGDYDKLKKLLAYSKAYRYGGMALMRWSITSFSTTKEGGSATDADIDIAAALFIAYEKTKDNFYLNEALEIGASIWDHEIDAATRLVLPATKSERMGNGTIYNISYISLPALAMFKKHDTNRDWATVLEKNLPPMEMVQNDGDGLWPDWSNASGSPVDPANGSIENLTASDGATLKSHEAYYKEAPRIPWRIAWYYHWFGDQRAKAMLDKGMAFLRDSKGVQSPNDLKNFYSYTGGKVGRTSAGVKDWASLCALGMGNSANQGWLNACNEKSLNWFQPEINTYYGSSLQVIYTMLFNGKF